MKLVISNSTEQNVRGSLFVRKEKDITRVFRVVLEGSPNDVQRLVGNWHSKLYNNHIKNSVPFVPVLNIGSFPKTNMVQCK